MKKGPTLIIENNFWLYLDNCDNLGLQFFPCIFYTNNGVTKLVEWFIVFGFSYIGLLFIVTFPNHKHNNAEVERDINNM